MSSAALRDTEFSRHPSRMLRELPTREAAGVPVKLTAVEVCAICLPSEKAHLLPVSYFERRRVCTKLLNVRITEDDGSAAQTLWAGSRPDDLCLKALVSQDPAGKLARS